MYRDMYVEAMGGVKKHLVKVKQVNVVYSLFTFRFPLPFR